MPLPASELRRYHRVVLVDPAAARERSIRRRVIAVWCLLYFNTLTYAPGLSVIDFPSKIGKGVAQGSLQVAILLALTVNPKIKVRPNVFLCIVSLLLVDTVLTAAEVHHFGTFYRTFRLIEYVFALWLLTPWWGRSDMLFLRVQLRCLYAALGSVFLGLCIAPGHAFAYDGRLTGTIWPMYPTAVAQFAAVAAGLTVVLWLARLVSGRATLAGVAFGIFILLLTHTRTALVGLVAGILVAGLSLFFINSRVRKFFATLAAIAAIAITTAAGFITTWLARGQSTAGLASLTGRTDFWSLVLNLQRNRLQEALGFGLSNASVNGLPIDSNWLSAYLQEGLFGVVVCAAMLVFLFIAAFFRSSGVRRALIMFLLTYCLLASFTEDSFTDVSPYLLYLTVAASLFTTVRSSRPAVVRAAEPAFAPRDLEEIGR
jgi:O-antigen ligase